MAHRNAPLSERGRLRLARVSSRTAGRSPRRRAVPGPPRPRPGGPAATGRPARPGWSTGPAAHTSRAHPSAVLRKVVHLRMERAWDRPRSQPGWGDASTVHRILVNGRGRLVWPTGRPGGRCAATNGPTPATWSTSTSRSWAASPTAAVARPRPPPATPQSGPGTHAHPGRHPRLGYSYVHTAIDDYSRLAYSEILADEPAATASGSGSAPRPSSPAMASRRSAC